MSKARQLADNGAAISNRNLIINGAMNVAQRSTSVSGLGADANAYQTVDRWRFLTNGTAGRYTLSQATDAPSGFGFSTKIDVTTADTSIAAGEYFFFRQLLEGQDLQQLNKGTSDAKKITVSFFVKGNANATYLVELEDADNGRLNSQTFNVTTSWTKIVKTFTADTTGALDNDNANSFNLGFWLHAGSTFTSGTHAAGWLSNATTGNRVPSSITSIFDSTDREFYITGIQMEIGEHATPFEHKTFGKDLVESRRYYTTHEFSGQEFVNIEANTATHKFCGFPLPGNMRTTPSVTLPSGMTGGAVSGLTGTVSAVTVTSTQENRCAFRVTMSEATGTARAVHHCDTFDADVATMDAEL
tara:strand:- start:281 stop:1354 length:1074 start_codon:yes stop_codon:yes gene_type:complete